MNRRRLFPEEIRDGMLQAPGALNLKMGGRPVVPPVDKEELYGLSQNRDNMWIVTANRRGAKAPKHLHVVAANVPAGDV